MPFRHRFGLVPAGILINFGLHGISVGTLVLAHYNCTATYFSSKARIKYLGLFAFPMYWEERI